MLSEEILKIIKNKHDKLANVYSKSLETTLKIFSVLQTDDFKNTAVFIEERDTLLLTAQNLINEINEMFKQLYKQEGISSEKFDDLKIKYSSITKEISAVKINVKNLISQIKSNDDNINKIINQSINGFKNKINNLKATKEIGRKYNSNNNYHTNFKLLV